jgi:hypothetical protein
MKVLLRQMCVHGAMLSDREIAAAPQIAGDLHMYTISGRRGVRTCVSLRDPNNHVAGDLLPKLWEPVLEGLGANMLRIRGLQGQTDKDKALHLQVWLCQLAHS